MRYIRKFLLLGCIVLIITLLSGCWNYREVEDLAIVSGFAVDKKDDHYLVTTEIISIGSGKDSKITTKLLSMEGTSIFDAFRNAIKIAGRRLYSSQAEIIIVSKEIAEEGIIPVLDFIGRDTEPRSTLHILVSKEKSAKEILEQQPVTSDILSFELNDMLMSEKSLSNALDIEEWQFANDLAGMGISATLPMIDLNKDNNKPLPEITGTGVFKEDKLVGFLDGEETKTLMFIKNKIKGGLLTNKEYQDGSPTNVALEIFSNKTKLKPKYVDGTITMEITTSTDVAIGENGGKDNYIDEAGREKVKKDFEAMLENNIKSLVKKVQEQYDSDIFGFGKTIKMNMPGLWKKIEPKWEQVYKNLDVEVHSTINIKNSAYMSRPIKVGD